MHDPLAQQIADFIQAAPSAADAAPSPLAPADDAAFNALALALFARQYTQINAYRRLCDSMGAVPGMVTRWQDIPAVPAAAFKAFELSCVPTAKTVAAFHSSGTTGAQTSRHLFDADALALYEISLARGYADALPDPPAQLWALMPPPSDAPHSSLSHMLGTLGAQRFFWDDDDALADSLCGLDAPVTLFGTAFAFVQLFDGRPDNWRLPPGSRIVETGGFKGRTREVPRDELYALFTQRLGVPLHQCWSEYGMCEMASQFYGHGLDPIKRGPHWVRTRLIDPAPGDDAAPGAPGLLRHFDLANFNSVLALQTQDRGVSADGGFLLMGRASDADLRGCSLTVEELWTRK